MIFIPTPISHHACFRMENGCFLLIPKIDWRPVSSWAITIRTARPRHRNAVVTTSFGIIGLLLWAAKCLHVYKRLWIFEAVQRHETWGGTRAASRAQSFFLITFTGNLWVCTSYPPAPPHSAQEDTLGLETDKHILAKEVIATAHR